MSLPVEILIIGIFVVLFLMNVPIAFVLGIVGMSGLMLTQDLPLPTYAQLVTSGIDSFPLIAIPLFIFAGIIMSESGMSTDLVDFSKIFLGRFRGGLLHVATGTAVLFGAITGSATADAAAVSTIMSGPLEKEGYNREFSTAIVATAGCLGAVIPPSINLIVVGSIAGISIWKLFMGSIIPGLLTGLGLMVISYIHAVRWKYETSETPTFKQSIKITGKAFFPLMLPVIILGGIYSGIFTPTEAAAVAATYAVLIAFIKSKMQFGKFFTCLVDTAKISSGPMLMVAMAGLFSYFLVMERIPESISKAILSGTLGPIGILFVMNALFFLVGMLMDTLPAMIILVPIFFPIAKGIGMDPVHFGVMVSFNCSMAMATPPVGVALFAACSIFKTSISEVTKPMLLLTVFVFLMVLVVTYIPWLSLALI